MLSPVFHNRVFHSSVFNRLPVVASGPVESNFALGFDGVNDYVSVPDSADLKLTGNFTVALWAKSNITGTSYGSFSPSLIAKEAASAGWNLRINVLNGKFEWVKNDTTTYLGTTVVAAGVWYYVVVTFDGATLKLYVNGREEFSGAYSSHASITASMDIGRSPFYTARTFNGLLDDIRIYNRALSATEVQSLYRNSSSPPISGLVAHFPFEEDTGTTTIDSVGGLVGTLTNGPTWQPQTPPRLIADRQTQTWSRSFVSASNQVVTGFASSISPTGGARTICAWVKPASTARMGIIGTRNIAVDGGFVLTTNRTTAGNLTYFHTGGSIIEKAAGISVGVWAHVAVTYNLATSTVELFSNGVSLGSQGLFSAEIANAFTGAIGSEDNSTGVSFNGNISDVRIYSSALSATQIADLARGKEIAATPVGHWRLDEVPGATTAVDSSGNGNNGTINGAVATGDIPQWIRQTIESSQSFSFDGVNGYVQTTLAPSGYSGLSISAWAKLDTAGYYRMIASYGTNGDNVLELRTYDTSGVIECARRVDNIAVRDSVNSTGTGWHHFVCTGDGTTFRLYKDGLLIGSTSASHSINSTMALRIGRRSNDEGGIFLWDGLIDDVRIYNRSLTPAEVIDTAAGFHVPAGLVGYWKADGNANDSSGNGNNGNEQGGVAYSTDVPGTL